MNCQPEHRPNNAESLQKCFNITSASQYLACSQKTVRHLVSSGELAAFRLAPSSRANYRITPEAMQDFVRRNQV